MDFKVLILVQQIYFLIPLTGYFLKLLFVYRSAVKNTLFKSLWILFFVCAIYDFGWCGFVSYKTIYRLLVSETPQPIYILIASLFLLFWPLIIFLQTLVHDWLIGADGTLHKRHYVFGAWSLALMGYFFYSFLVREPIPSNPWLTHTSFCALLMNFTIMANRLSTLVYGIKKLFVEPEMSLIIKHQTKLILGLMVVPPILLQPIWILQNYGMLPVGNLALISFIFILSVAFVTGFYYALFGLFRLRLFNAVPMVRSGFFSRDYTKPFFEIMQELRKVTCLQEINACTRTYFAAVFGFKSNQVALYIRPANHAGVVEPVAGGSTLARVEALYCSTEPEQVALREKIKQKKILLHAEVHYDELHNLNVEARALRVFLEENNAEVFIPVYEEQNFLGYIIVERHARQGKLISDVEVAGMLAYADHVSYVIEHRQKIDPRILEQKCVEYASREKQLYQEREHCHEGMSVMAAHVQTSQAVSIIYSQYNRLQVANTDGAAMLGLSEGTVVIPEYYKEALGRLINGYKKQGRTDSISFKDLQGKPLRFTPMKLPFSKQVVIAVSRPTCAESFTFPSFAAIKNNNDWDYALFLQTTASGKLLESFIPVGDGIFFDFKIKCMRAVFTRRPLLFSGAEKDVRRLAEIAHKICARDVFYPLSLNEQEHGCEIATQIFGVLAVSAEEKDQKGLLATLRESGTLFIERVERLSLKTQDALAAFMMTGSYTSFCSRQLASSDVQIICSSYVNLKELTEQGLFSAALYQELVKNSVNMPALTAVPKDQLGAFVRTIGMQVLGEKVIESDLLVTSSFVEEILSKPLPSNLCDLRHCVKKELEQKCSQKELAKVVPLDVDLNDSESVIAEARRLGREALKYRDLFCKLVDVVNSYARIARILGVDPTTIYRTCKKYQVGTFAPGYVRQRGRPKRQQGAAKLATPLS